MSNSSNEIGSLAAVREGSGPASWGEGVWHSSGVSKYPSSLSAFDDIGGLTREFCLKGHSPTAPILNVAGNVVAIGSCFAAELRHFLSDVGLSSNSFWIPSGLNNTFALCDFFSWVVTGNESARGYAYERGDAGSIRDWKPELEQEEYRKAIEDAAWFVFTLGLAEVWEDAKTGKVFWRGVPENVFEEGRHRFRLSSVSENTSNIDEVIKFIRLLNPTASIVLTLSPVPLKASFSEKSCITSDCVSKSVLRLAINDYLSKEQLEEGVYYWPSFEIVKWLGCHLPYPVYGTDDGVVRHVSRFVVNKILELFVEHYYGKEIAIKVFKDYLPTLKQERGKMGSLH